MRRSFWELELTRNQAECSKNKQTKSKKKKPPKQKLCQKSCQIWTFGDIMDWGNGFCLWMEVGVDCLWGSFLA